MCAFLSFPPSDSCSSAITMYLRSSTGLRMPRLMGNWEHLLSRNRFADQTIPVMREFQKNLKQLSDDIEARNRDRESTTGFTMESFDPVNMESSVSV